jgi:pilus assembly protein CpaF
MSPVIEDLGPLSVLLADPAVTDVLVNGPDEIWVDRGAGLCRTTSSFADEAAVRALAVRLAASAGRRLDTGAPFADVRLADGSRLHAVLPPVSPNGTCLSLRVLSGRRFDLDGLQRCGTLDAEQAVLVRRIVAARLAVLVSGGTGTGKTTLLGALLGAAAGQERLVLVEDAAELRVDHPHVVRLEGRTANVEGAGTVALRDLVRQALRMRPDRIVVGEVRGPEVLDLLVALNTGHEGGMATVHANSAVEVPARLEALGALAGLGRAALHSQVCAAVDVVLHLVRDRTGVRRLREIAVLHRDPDGWAVLLPVRSPVRTGLHSDDADPGAESLARLLERRESRS